MRIAVASDHGGYELKESIKQHLIESGHEVHDAGTYSTTSVSYVDYGHRACKKVQDGSCERAILVCGTGIGMSVVANKHKGFARPFARMLLWPIWRADTTTRTCSFSERVFSHPLCNDFG